VSEQLPVLLFLVPFVTAVSLPIVGTKHASWCRPLTIGSVTLSKEALFDGSSIVELDADELKPGATLALEIVAETEAALARVLARTRRAAHRPFERGGAPVRVRTRRIPLARLATAALLAGDTDPDTNDALAVTAIDTTGTVGTVTLVAGVVSYDPNGQFEYLAAGETATDTFSYTIDDGNGGSDSATVTAQAPSYQPRGRTRPLRRTRQRRDRDPPLPRSLFPGH